MIFPQFWQSIGSPALQAVAHHWNEARGKRKMPSWQDLSPKAITPHLPLVWAYKFDAQSRDFVGRLAGERIARAYGKNFRGSPLAEIHTAPDSYQTVHALLLRVVSEPAIFRGRGRVYQLQGEFQSGERIILPLSSDGIVSDGVFGATEIGSLSVVHQPVQGFQDAGDWFSLSTNGAAKQ